MNRVIFRSLMVLASSFALSTAWGQGAETPPVKFVEFPSGARTPAAPELAEKLGEKVWKAQFANGSTGRYEFRGQYVYVDLSSGARDNGRWRTEDGRLCVEFRGRFASGCSDVVLHEGRPVFRRATTGELITLQTD